MRIKRGRHPPSVVFDREARQKFLSYIAQGWSEEYARKRCHVGHVKYQRYKHDTPEWTADLDAAAERGILSIEDEAHRRAKHGVLNPVVGNGKIVTYRREFSDTLMSLTLKARSKKYAANSATSANLEITLSGAAQILFDRLSALVEHADKVERDSLDSPSEDSSKASRRKKAAA